MLKKSQKTNRYQINENFNQNLSKLFPFRNFKIFGTRALKVDQNFEKIVKIHVTIEKFIGIMGHKRK